MKKEDFMRKAIELSIENVKNGGGPFGAVIVKGDEVIATGVNRVTANHDPTAHAEVSAIRAACEKLGTFDLEGCEIYTSCEPCPMCLGAIYWAHLDKIYYGNNKTDAARIGSQSCFPGMGRQGRQGGILRHPPFLFPFKINIITIYPIISDIS